MHIILGSGIVVRIVAAWIRKQRRVVLYICFIPATKVTGAEWASRDSALGGINCQVGSFDGCRVQQESAHVVCRHD
jgi:hypothetical protein